VWNVGTSWVFIRITIYISLIPLRRQEVIVNNDFFMEFFKILLGTFGSIEMLKYSEPQHPPSNPRRSISSVQSNIICIDSINRIDIEYRIGLTLFS
jgi:hypothetical protein